MRHLDQAALGDGRVLDFDDFSEDPPSSRVLTIYEHVLLEVLLFNLVLAADDILDKVV